MNDLSDVSVRQVLRSMLHAIGLDPGRAVANANPSEVKLDRDREVLRTAISEKCADSRAEVNTGPRGPYASEATSPKVQHLDEPTGSADAGRFTARHSGSTRHNPYVDAGWWPRSLDLDGELEPLLCAARAAGFDTSRVTYRLGDPWVAPARNVLVGGKQIKLSGYHNHRAGMVTLIDGGSHELLEVMVIPPDTDSTVAELALQIATVHADPTQGQAILAMADGIAHATG